LPLRAAAKVFCPFGRRFLAAIKVFCFFVFVFCGGRRRAAEKFFCFGFLGGGGLAVAVVLRRFIFCPFCPFRRRRKGGNAFSKL